MKNRCVLLALLWASASLRAAGDDPPATTGAELVDDETIVSERVAPAPGASTPVAAVDRAHRALSSSVVGVGRWVDDFFGAEREEVEANYSYLRMTPGMQWDDDDGFDATLRVRGKLHLPDTNDRIALVVARDRDEGSATALDTEDRSAIQSGDLDDSGFGLQFVPTRSRKNHVSLLAAIDSNLDPEFSVRARRYVYPAEDTYAFGSVRPFWSNDIGWGVALGSELNVGVGEQDLLRFAIKGVAAEDVDGWEWKSAVGWFRQLDEKSAVSMSFAVRGVTEPNVRAEVFTLGPTYRRNFWRPWTFWSVRPFVSWRRELDRPTDRIHGIEFELDLYAGHQRDRSAPDPVPLEPAEDERDLGGELRGPVDQPM